LHSLLQSLLKLDGKLVTVGVPPHPLELPTSSLIFGRKSVAGSLIGGIKETQEMLDFCGEHNITSDVSCSAGFLSSVVYTFALLPWRLFESSTGMSPHNA
jgi:D-arabinose 1-dehydrogenase-like Zn-dependent alcohol dehydrogenase